MDEAQEDLFCKFRIEQIKKQTNSFSTGMLYSGTIEFKEGSIPCKIFCKNEKTPKKFSESYLLGTLQKKGPFQYFFQAKKWIPIETKFNLAKLRYKTKKHLKRFLSREMPSKKVSSLLASLLLGDTPTKLQRYEFNRLGLQHILAVSGFHFGILIIFLNITSQFFLSQKKRIFLLMLATFLYFLLIGDNPAVFRCWIGTELYLLGKLLKRFSSGLNLLGSAFLIELILNPLVLTSLAFQLSFASCFAILLFFPFFQKKLDLVLPERSYSELLKLSFFSRKLLLITSPFKNAFSLTLSVNLLILPLLLFHFHCFPCLSLLYNLFYPLLIGFSLILLYLSLIFYPLILPVSKILFSLNLFYTSLIIDLAAYPPLLLERFIRTNQVTPLFILSYFFIFLFLGIYLRGCRESLTNRS